MTGGKKLLDQIQIDLLNDVDNSILKIYIDVHDNSLSRKWLTALNYLLKNNYHLEKNYCFFGFTESKRSAQYILDQINQSIKSINQADLGYRIDDHFTLENTINTGPVGEDLPGGTLIHHKLNGLHRYFEDLQGVSGSMSPYYNKASGEIRWHIRQLNLLCHEYESLVLSMRKKIHAPEWQRPSQLMCWLNAPRFQFEDDDFELFGVETIARPLGGVFVGVNKAIGKHHYEVFNDEATDLEKIAELTTTSMRSQTEAAGDFDIEWSQSTVGADWMKQHLNDFRKWLVNNGFDPDDKNLTIGHPQVGQVDLFKTFGTDSFQNIMKILNNYLNVYKIKTSDAVAVYEYNWDDPSYVQQQVKILNKGP